MKHLLLSLFLLAFAAQLQASRIYVRQQGNTENDGSAWSRATTLKTALSAATAGDEIWVAAGTYLTSRQGDRTQRFVVPAGVSVYGGFTGGETNMEERSPLGTSILSGELGQADDLSDNAYTVVELLAGPGLSSTLEGFEITGGNAQHYEKKYDALNAGGGLYLHATVDGRTTHLIKNCTIRENRAHSGGGAFIAGGRPVFVNCAFSGNDADFYGGAVYNSGRQRDAAPTFQQCTFVDNASSSGAGLTNDASPANCHPILVACTFTDNTSLVNGAAIFNIQRGGGRCALTLENCQIDGNRSILNRDVAGFGGQAITVYDSRGDRQGKKFISAGEKRP